jgi:hypothetical protein
MAMESVHSISKLIPVCEISHLAATIGDIQITDNHAFMYTAIQDEMIPMMQTGQE